MAEDTQYRIDRCDLLSSILNCLFSYSFIIYYTYSLSTIPHDLVTNPITILFYIYTAINYLYTLPAIIEIIYIYKYMGEITTKKLWKSISPSNRFPLTYLKILRHIMTGIGCYFLNKFIPAGMNNCFIYTNVAENACISLQIISIFTIIELIFLGFIGIIIFSTLCFICCANGYHSFKQIREKIEKNRIANAILERYTIINGPQSDGCAICLSDIPESSSEKWLVLTCNHKFHVDCIRDWISLNTTCPLCRKVQDIPV